MTVINSTATQQSQPSQGSESFEFLIKLLCKLEHLDAQATKEFLDLYRFTQSLETNISLNPAKDFAL